MISTCPKCLIDSILLQRKLTWWITSCFIGWKMVTRPVIRVQVAKGSDCPAKDLFWSKKKQIRAIRLSQSHCPTSLTQDTKKHLACGPFPIRSHPSQRWCRLLAPKIYFICRAGTASNHLSFYSVFPFDCRTLTGPLHFIFILFRPVINPIFAKRELLTFFLF